MCWRVKVGQATLSSPSIFIFSHTALIRALRKIGKFNNYVLPKLAVGIAFQYLKQVKVTLSLKLANLHAPIN